MDRENELKEVMGKEKKLDEKLQVGSGKDEYFEKFIFEKEKIKRAKEKLAYYKKVVMDSNDAIIVQDFNGVVKSWNKGAEQIYGFKGSEMIGKNIIKIIDKVDRAKARKNIADIKRGRPTFRTNQTRKIKGGGKVYVWITYSPIYEDDEIIEIATTEQDVTKGLKSVRDLRISEERLSSIIRSIPEGMDIVDEKCNILWMNDYFLERFGKKVIGKKCYKVYKDDGMQCKYCPLKKGFEVGESKTLIIRGAMDGRILEVSHIGIIYEEKKAVLEIFKDVTDEVNTKNEIERVNRVLRVIAESNLAVLRSLNEIELIEKVCNIIVHIGKYRMVWIGVAKHDEGKSVLPIAQAGFVKGYLKDLNITWKNSERGRGPTGRAIRSGKVVVCKNILEDPKFKPWRKEAIKREYASSMCVPFRVNSKEVWTMNIYSRHKNVFDKKEMKLLVNLADNLSRGIISLRNKIEKKKMEDVVKLKDRLIRQTGEMALVGGWEFDVQTFEGTWTEETARIHDLEPKEKTNVKLGLSFYQGEYRKKIEEAIHDAIKKGLSYDLELEMISGKGVHKWVRTIGSPVRKKGKIVKIRGSFQDITEKRKMEVELCKSEEKNRQIFEQSPIAKFVINEKHEIIVWNKALEILTGISSKEVLGTKNQWRIFHPKKKLLVADLIIECAISKIYKLYKNQWKKSKWINNAFERIDFFPSIGKFGVWLHITASPLIGSDGKVMGVLEVLEDITTQKNAEMELLKSKEELEKKVMERTMELEESEMKFRTLYKSSKDAIMILEPPKWNFTSANPATLKMFNFKNEDDFYSKTPYLISPKYQADGKLSSEKGVEMINLAMEKGSNFFEWTHVKSDGEEFPATVLLTRMKIKDKVVLQATVRDITEMKKVLDDLRESNEALKKLDRVKSDFLNMVSHELKTPLTVISSHLEILMDRDFDLKKEDINSWTESMSAIKRNNDQLKILINNLLEISRLQSKTFELNIEKVDASEILSEVIEGLEILVMQDDVKIIKDVCKIPKVSVDKDRLVEIFNNVILNAIKFTDKGFIKISCRREGEFVLFDIADSGIGIKKSQLPHLFEKFYQVGDSLSRKYAGSGLGLSITKQLLELQGGDISVKSVYGKGSTFTIKLPIKHRISKEYVAMGKARHGKVGKVVAVERRNGFNKFSRKVEDLNPLEKEARLVEKLFGKINGKNV